MGLVNIYFGKVVDVKDDEKKNRVKVSIPGYTDEIPKDDLPWYFPFFGLKYLPIENDIVPVLIFNENFTHGFYNSKIDLVDNGLSGTEYENYVELYKRLGVEAYYKESEGWFFKNKDSSIQINEEQIDIKAVKKINHNSGAEPMVLGIQLFKILDRLMDGLLAETHTTPSGPSGPPINATTYSDIKSDLDKIKSKLSFLE